MTEPLTAYERGVEMGKIDARLAAHDSHFSQINGSIDRMGASLDALQTSVAAGLIEARLNRSRREWILSVAVVCLSALSTFLGFTHLL